MSVIGIVSIGLPLNNQIISLSGSVLLMSPLKTFFTSVAVFTSVIFILCLLVTGIDLLNCAGP